MSLTGCLDAVSSVPIGRIAQHDGIICHSFHSLTAWCDSMAHRIAQHTACHSFPQGHRMAQDRTQGHRAILSCHAATQGHRMAHRATHGPQLPSILPSILPSCHIMILFYIIIPSIFSYWHILILFHISMISFYPSIFYFIMLPIVIIIVIVYISILLYSCRIILPIGTASYGILSLYKRL